MQRPRHEDWGCIMSKKKKREEAAKKIGIDVATLKMGELAIEKAARAGACMDEAIVRGMEAVNDRLERQLAEAKGTQ